MLKYCPPCNSSRAIAARLIEGGRAPGRACIFAFVRLTPRHMIRSIDMRCASHAYVGSAVRCHWYAQSLRQRWHVSYGKTYHGFTRRQLSHSAMAAWVRSTRERLFSDLPVAQLCPRFLKQILRGVVVAVMACSGSCERNGGAGDSTDFK